MHSPWITYFRNCCCRGSLWNENSDHSMTGCSSALEISPYRCFWGLIAEAFVKGKSKKA